ALAPLALAAVLGRDRSEAIDLAVARLGAFLLEADAHGLAAAARADVHRKRADEIVAGQARLDDHATAHLHRAVALLAAALAQHVDGARGLDLGPELADVILGRSRRPGGDKEECKYERRLVHAGNPLRSPRRQQ